MKATTFDQCRAALRATGRYETPPERRAATRRAPGWWTTLSFSWGPFSVFPKCALYSAVNALTVERWARFCFAPIPLAEAFGMNVIFDGWENRRDCKGPVIFLANHMSTLETILLPYLILGFCPFKVVVKQSLSHLPFLEKAARDMGLVPLGRTSPREDLMTIFREGVQAVKEGKSVLIFPQGSRERVFARKGFSSIGAKLAEKAGVPVMPIAVRTDCEPTRPNGTGWFKDFGTVDTSKDIRVRCGAPISGTAREMHAASFDWIRAQLAEWGLPTEG